VSCLLGGEEAGDLLLEGLRVKLTVALPPLSGSGVPEYRRKHRAVGGPEFPGDKVLTKLKERIVITRIS
jgi:hypothetical protein